MNNVSYRYQRYFPGYDLRARTWPEAKSTRCIGAVEACIASIFICRDANIVHEDAVRQGIQLCRVYDCFAVIWSWLETLNDSAECCRMCSKVTSVATDINIKASRTI